MHPVRVIDSHTGGEPTRVVVSGGPDLGRGTMAERRLRFARECDAFRSAVVNEPRGSDVIVGALLCEPHEPDCQAGVIFFNNVGVLNMCAHGTIGLAVTLAHLGVIGPGEHRFDTAVGVVGATLDEDRQHVVVRNVLSYRAAADVPLDVPGLGRVHGDVAWGGNWFFLAEDHRQAIEQSNIERLGDVAWRIRQAIVAAGVTGDDGGEIDHIELFGPPQASVHGKAGAGGKGADSKNFVLCPGRAYDRSPCGTGTSAKLACLAARGKLRPGEMWRQESIVGSIFEGWIEPHERGVIPFVRGSAYVTADSTLLFHEHDPFRQGIRL